MDWMQMLTGGPASPTDDQKKTTEEMWRLYTNAANIKPVPTRMRDGSIQYVFPQAAIDRFKVLLPMLQATQQMQNQGQGQGKNQEGLLQGGLKSILGGFAGAGLKKLKGYEGIMDKIGSLWKDPTDTGLTPLQNMQTGAQLGGDPSMNPNGFLQATGYDPNAGGFDYSQNAPTMDLSSILPPSTGQQFSDNYEPPQGGEDWTQQIPVDVLSGVDYPTDIAYGDWGW